MEDNTNKKKVLVVDDDNNLRTVLTDKLNASGFEAVSASDGQDGLNKALEWRPDVILLDVLMPKLSGLEVLGKLRENEWGKTVKVIMLTVLEDTDAVAQAVDKGTFAYLLKTNKNLNDVVKQVRETLDN